MPKQVAPANAQTRRVSIDLTATAAAEVDRLRAATSLTTADVFRFALVLFRRYVDAALDGERFFIGDKSKENLTGFELPIMLGRPHDGAAVKS